MPNDAHPGLVKLPEPGGYLPDRGPPCGACGAATFDVVRCSRRYRLEDGTEGRREVVDVRCPRCVCLTDDKDVSRETIGMFDTTTGALTITGA